MWRRAAAAILASSLLGCAGPNLFTDLGSVSTGTVNRGRIRNPTRMPITGKGWRVPPRWKRRGFHWATDELIAAVQRAAGRVRSFDRRAVLGVADFYGESVVVDQPSCRQRGDSRCTIRVKAAD